MKSNLTAGQDTKPLAKDKTVKSTTQNVKNMDKKLTPDFNMNKDQARDLH